MTTAYNNLVRGAPRSVFESAKNVVDSTTTVNQGDLCSLNSVTLMVQPVSASTDAPFFVGVAKQTLINGKVKSPYIGTAVDAAQAIEDVAGPGFGAIYELTMKTGDAFPVACAVYLTGDAQILTSVDPGTHDHVGIYQGPAVAVAAAGQKGYFLIGERYTSSTLVI
jgi:hypothetical protein